ncbi:MAG: hypothetical protein WCT24_02435 [Patescibacteria group bacterium]|jgi:hypothetical protein
MSTDLRQPLVRSLEFVHQIIGDISSNWFKQLKGIAERDMETSEEFELAYREFYTITPDHLRMVLDQRVISSGITRPPVTQAPKKGMQLWAFGNGIQQRTPSGARADAAS